MNWMVYLFYSYNTMWCYYYFHLVDEETEIHPELTSTQIPPDDNCAELEFESRSMESHSFTQIFIDSSVDLNNWSFLKVL